MNTCASAVAPSAPRSAFKASSAPRVAFTAMLLAALAGCAAPQVRSDRSHLAAQAARERMLAARPVWSLDGRLAVSSGDDGGSGGLEWSQNGAQFLFRVHAPLSGKTWELSGGDHHARLSGVRAQPIDGDDAARLLERELGWHVPVDQLIAWVRGMRAPGPARIEFRADGLPAEIDQAGWVVQYRDYDSASEPPLPSKIFASNGDHRVRLSVRHWSSP